MPANDRDFSFADLAFHIAASPFLTAEVREEAVRKSAHAAEARRSSGVCQSGMGPGAFHSRTRDQLLQAAEARRARHEDYKASPRGRLFAAIKSMFEIGFTAEADKLRGIYDRSLADEREPVDAAACGAALTILNTVPGQDARDAIEAIAELLMGRPLLMAAE